MAREPKLPQSEAEQRRELGGYSEAEFDREFVRSQRSDLVSVAVRVVLLVIVYGLLARAIHRFDPPPWLLVLPFASEFLAIFVVGWFLSRFVISCKSFRKSAGGTVLLLFWMLLIVGAMALAVVFNPGGADRVDTPQQAFAEAWQWIVRTDLHWALAAMFAALLGSTFQEVVRWKQERGVFVWAAIMTAGFRFGIAFLVAFLATFVLIFAGELLLPAVGRLFDGGGSALTWIVYGFIVLVEVLTLVVAVLMHRDALKPKSAKAAAAKPRRGVLP
ncbi:MAG: hypothetical protein IPG63_09240 [Xanthomonadales bacterium]|nr:hypothetical protein [Xanthomonadales bacterium]